MAVEFYGGKKKSLPETIKFLERKLVQCTNRDTIFQEEKDVVYHEKKVLSRNLNERNRSNVLNKRKGAKQSNNVNFQGCVSMRKIVYLKI